MPRIELRDPFGMSYTIYTRNRRLLQMWFDEWLPWIFRDAPAELGDPLLMVFPAWDKDNVPDWPADTRVIGRWETIPRDPALALDALDKLKARLEEKLEVLREQDKTRYR